MRKIFTILMVMIFAHGLFAQFPCGISHADNELITERLIANKQTLKEGFVSQRDGETLWLPIKFHLIGTSSGSQTIAEEWVLRQLDLLNRDYIDQEIQFFIEGGFNYIENTSAFNNPSSGAGLILLGAQRLNGRINIFVPRTANTGGGSLGTTLGFYSPNNDWIVIRQAELLSLTPTLTHEMGHFLSLLHPHSGWDAETYDPAVHNPTPEFSPGGRETENEDRTGNCKNCETAGDLLCDTPPDYNFGFGWNDCDYDAGTLDPCGVVVDPQETNFMGYFLNCDSYVFTNQQKQLMEVDVANRIATNSIFGSIVPETIEAVEGDIVVNFPEIDGFSYQAEKVYFNWDPVPGATDYIFEFARSITGFSGSTRVFLENGQNDITIDEPFIPNTEYIWRIYPFNQSSTGYDWSETFTFTTGEIVNVSEISEISSFELYPNLVTYQNEVSLDINSSESFDVDVQLVDLSGKVVTTMASSVTNGNNKINLTLGDLSAGVYFVKIVSATGILSKKLIVQ